jgi:TonB family protein
MNLRPFGLVAAFVTASCVYAQTDAHGLQQAIKGKQLFLRSFSAQSVNRYSWENGVLVSAGSGVHTLAVFTADSVKQKGKKLEISGLRASLSCDRSSKRCGLTGRNDVRLEIELNDAEPATVFPQLQECLFFADESVAIEALPKSVTSFFAPLVHSEASSESPASQPPDLKVTTPRLLKSAEPEYTEEARQAKINGSVMLAFVVDTSGTPKDLWVLRSLGYGLDEEAARALRRYVFAPAMQGGKPVPVGLAVEVNFAIF